MGNIQFNSYILRSDTDALQNQNFIIIISFIYFFMRKMD